MTAVVKMEDTDTAQRRLAFQKSYSIERGESWRRRSLIEDAKFDTASNAEFNKRSEEVTTNGDMLSNGLSNGVIHAPSHCYNMDADIDPEDGYPRERESISEEEEKSSATASTGVDAVKKITITLTLKETLVTLNKILKCLENYSVTVTHLESKLPKENDGPHTVVIDCQGKRHCFSPLITALKANSNITEVKVNFGDGEDIIWFPTHITELDSCHHLMTKFEPELDIDHPGFTDPEYRERRKEIADLAFNYRTNQAIPTVNYNDKEINTWGSVFRTLKDLHRQHACQEYLNTFAIMEKELGLNEHFIPQLEDVSRVLKKQSGFCVRPVAGLLTARDFLASLAFRTFQCTQYVRHPSKPHHSPEPDCIHDILGHCPMFCNPTFAQFSQEMGLASLGASDHDIEKFSTLYWFTVEFGLLKQNDDMKIYGAGIMSSFGELLHAVSEKPEKRPFDPFKAAVQDYRDEDYQPIYFIVESLEDMKEQMRAYAATIKHPYEVRYNPYTQSVMVLDEKQIIEDTITDLKREIAFVERALSKITRMEVN